MTTNGVHHATDESIDHLYAWMPPQPTPQSCPEALFSCTLKGKLDGIETLLTVRGMTAAEFQTNLTAIRGLLDAPQAPAPAASTPAPLSPQQYNAMAQHRPLTGVCPIHQVAMKEQEKDGRRWWSHRHDGQWCKGK